MDNDGRQNKDIVAVDMARFFPRRNHQQCRNGNNRLFSPKCDTAEEEKKKHEEVKGTGIVTPQFRWSPHAPLSFIRFLSHYDARCRLDTFVENALSMTSPSSSSSLSSQVLYLYGPTGGGKTTLLWDCLREHGIIETQCITDIPSGENELQQRIGSSISATRKQRGSGRGTVPVFIVVDPIDAWLTIMDQSVKKWLSSCLCSFSSSTTIKKQKKEIKKGQDDKEEQEDDDRKDQKGTEGKKTDEGKRRKLAHTFSRTTRGSWKENVWWILVGERMSSLECLEHGKTISDKRGNSKRSSNVSLALCPRPDIQRDRLVKRFSSCPFAHYYTDINRLISACSFYCSDRCDRSHTEKDVEKKNEGYKKNTADKKPFHRSISFTEIMKTIMPPSDGNEDYDIQHQVYDDINVGLSHEENVDEINNTNQTASGHPQKNNEEEEEETFAQIQSLRKYNNNKAKRHGLQENAPYSKSVFLDLQKPMSQRYVRPTAEYIDRRWMEAIRDTVNSDNMPSLTLFDPTGTQKNKGSISLLEWSQWLSNLDSQLIPTFEETHKRGDTILLNNMEWISQYSVRHLLFKKEEEEEEGNAIKKERNNSLPRKKHAHQPQQQNQTIPSTHWEKVNSITVSRIFPTVYTSQGNVPNRLSMGSRNYNEMLRFFTFLYEYGTFYKGIHIHTISDSEKRNVSASSSALVSKRMWKSLYDGLEMAYLNKHIHGRRPENFDSVYINCDARRSSTTTTKRIPPDKIKYVRKVCRTSYTEGTSKIRVGSVDAIYSICKNELGDPNNKGDGMQNSDSVSLSLSLSSSKDPSAFSDGYSRPKKISKRFCHCCRVFLFFQGPTKCPILYDWMKTYWSKIDREHVIKHERQAYPQHLWVCFVTAPYGLSPIKYATFVPAPMF
jgi:hypothetical protein